MPCTRSTGPPVRARLNRERRAFIPGFKQEPYWWDAAPRRQEPARPVPSTTDVAIIGSGFTALSAALTLARGGREVTILEEGSLGYGASSRNFGMLGRQHKYDLTTLIARFGLGGLSSSTRPAIKPLPSSTR